MRTTTQHTGHSTRATTSKATTTSKAAKAALRSGAKIVGGIGVFALGLSVIHCTQSINALTGSGMFLAALLAVAIDAGMIACECAELLAHDTSAHAHVKPWATAYIVMAVVLSMFLNAYGSAMHAPAGMRYGSYVIGAVVPVLVYVLGKVAGHMWTAR